MAPLFFLKDSPLERPFRSTWDILSETTSFINMREDAEYYQDMLRDWRRRLQAGSRDPEIQRQVREEIVILRKAFRKNGYDVSLGSFDIQCEGFRTDISMKEGYRRIVLLIADRVILYEEGVDNHLNLWEALEQKSRKICLSGNREYHYLWYRWRGRILYLAGADSEPKESYPRFCQIVQSKKLLLLASLKKLR